MADYVGRHLGAADRELATEPASEEPGTPRPPRIGVPVIALAVLLLQAAFIASYVGGLHAPSPKHIPVAVVGGPDAVAQLSAGLGPSSDIVSLTPASDLASARRAIRDRDADAAFDPSTGTLVLASGRGPAADSVLTPLFSKVAGGRLTTHDVAPLPSADPRGLVTFYLVIGWIVGAYLLAAVLGIVGGMAPSSGGMALRRTLVFVVYAIGSGIGGAAIVQYGFGYVTGSFWALSGVGVLLVFAVGIATVGLEALFGLVGTALAILAFVVAGNPSAGGPWPITLLPSPWREFGPYLPNGASLTAVRQALFFDRAAMLAPLGVLAAYAVGGLLLTFAMTRRGRPLVELL
jgi:hypothetical protein